jgi:hypothetical protein
MDTRLSTNHIVEPDGTVKILDSSLHTQKIIGRYETRLITNHFSRLKLWHSEFRTNMSVAEVTQCLADSTAWSATAHFITNDINPKSAVWQIPYTFRRADQGILVLSFKTNALHEITFISKETEFVPNQTSESIAVKRGKLSM